MEQAMKYLASIIAMLIFPGTLAAQHGEHSPAKADGPASLMTGLGSLHHPVTTANTQAQRFFDQGLTLVYAFNHHEAIRSFKRAAELDPKLAMAYWGIALATGPNYNMDVDPAREKEAFDASQKARSLEGGASPNETGYIEALAQRYSDDSKADYSHLAMDYKNAMAALVKRFPDDLDAAALYAESMMDLRPWRLWNSDGTPAEGTPEIVSVLESVLRRDPNHIGANHFYIHALEASPHAEKALASAGRLRTLAPEAGHLVHMPAHIYERTGDYAAAVASNEAGAAVDQEYIKTSGGNGMYPLMYYSHNLHFLAVAACMEGNFAKAKNATGLLADHLRPHLKDNAFSDAFMTAPILVLVRFHRWADILALEQPEADLPLTTVVWHFARGMAYAGLGQIDKARAESAALHHAEEALPAGSDFGFSDAHTVFKIAENMLGAKLDLEKHDYDSAIGLFKQAVQIEDTLPYDEPPDWYLPSRESLGAVLYLNHNYTEAEAVFRADLEAHPKSGRSLFGLMRTLTAVGKASEAREAGLRFRQAWRNADTKLTIEDL
ncbi:MAG TPA: hypothetical protein VJX67_05870 [Blastocatellia bacterium]|nr:hypothetical protein [Blastocatellia bacterium]